MSTQLLGLDVGIVSNIEGDVYTVRNVYAPAGGLHCGQQFDVGTTYCSITLQNAADVLSIPQMSKSKHADHPCFRKFQLECYLGIGLDVNK